MEADIPILYYHFIKLPSANTRIKGLYTSVKHFEWQIKFLKSKGFAFITFEDVRNGNYEKKKRNVILTFDDGCDSLYYNAFPVLKKYGIKAVIYVVAKSIGARNIVWPLNENLDPLNILTKEQIHEMTNFGIEFGSHLCHHVHLPQLSLNEIKSELSESKLILESELGREVYSVAYPFGSYNNDVLKIALETGYQFGVTTKSGNNAYANDLELFRYPVKGYSLRHYWYFYRTMRKLLKNLN
jgi:peptidoglycan/xylan/chitin deacetylase (PgdA/CDA1 family)